MTELEALANVKKRAFFSEKSLKIARFAIHPTILSVAKCNLVNVFNGIVSTLYFTLQNYFLQQSFSC